MVAVNKSNELRITRVLEAPVKAVWEAWTDEKQVAQWWGPRGFTITTHSKELRAGGAWVYTMHGPDGVDYPNKTVYLEVEKYARLVYDHGANDERPALFRVTVEFSDENGKTRMEMVMALKTAEAAEETRKMIKKVGGNSTWDRLAEYVKKQAGKETFVIARTFEVGVERMYEMWTVPEHFMKWLPPTGFTMRFLREEMRVGGTSFYVMEGMGVKMYGRVKYLEMEKPGKVVYTQEFCDEKEGMSRHPMVPVWPERMLTTVRLTEAGAGRTLVTVTWEPYGAVGGDEMAVFVGMKGSMTQGWTGSLDKLEELLG